MGLEIERKWLVKDILQNVPYDVQAKVEQFYVNFNPELRFRKYNHSFISNASLRFDPYIMTLKTDGGLTRKENNFKIEERIYYYMLNNYCKPKYTPITKDYYIFIFNGLRIEYNRVFFGYKYLFTYAEVEFETEEEAKNFEFPFPATVIKEITDDPFYKMKNVFKEENKIID